MKEQEKVERIACALIGHVYERIMHGTGRLGAWRCKNCPWTGVPPAEAEKLIAMIRKA